MKGRQLTVEEVNNLKEGDIVYIEPIGEIFQKDIGRAEIVFNDDERNAVPEGIQDFESPWEIYDYDDNDAEHRLKIYEWIEEAKEQAKEFKLSEIVFDKNAISKSLGKDILTNESTKADLKTGMWVECINKNQYMVMLNASFRNGIGDILISTTGWNSLSSYNDNLESIENETGYNICKIYKTNFASDIYKGIDLKLIWERKEKKPKNHIEQTVNRTFTYNNETIILTQHEAETTVKLTDGTIATIHCDEKIEFDRDKGLEIAYWIAKRIQADKMLNKIRG